MFPIFLLSMLHTAFPELCLYLNCPFHVPIGLLSKESQVLLPLHPRPVTIRDSISPLNNTQPPDSIINLHRGSLTLPLVAILSSFAFTDTVTLFCPIDSFLALPIAHTIGHPTSQSHYQPVSTTIAFLRIQSECKLPVLCLSEHASSLGSQAL